jgi:hypothetical protein
VYRDAIGKNNAIIEGGQMGQKRDPAKQSGTVSETLFDVALFQSGSGLLSVGRASLE